MNPMQVVAVSMGLPMGIFGGNSSRGDEYKRKAQEQTQDRQHRGPTIFGARFPFPDIDPSIYNSVLFEPETNGQMESDQ